MELNEALAALTALSQGTRLAVFRLLVEAGRAGLPVAEIGASVPSSPATMSFHLKQLVHAGLITPRQDGRQIFYSADYQRMNDLLAFLTENCCVRDASSCRTDGCGDADVSKSVLADRRERSSRSVSRTSTTTATKKKNRATRQSRAHPRTPRGPS